MKTNGVVYVFLCILIHVQTLVSIRTSTYFYCMPWNATCWPDDHDWKSLEQQIDGKLHSLKSSMYEECVEQGSSAYNISKTGHGICMQYHDCSKRFCDGSKEWNLPVKSVEVTSVKDIRTTLAFANRHNIAITIKTSGHSYSGSSTGAGTLMIWMRNFTKFTTEGIKRNYTDTCGKKYDKVLKVGGGETWKDAYSAVGSQYNMVGGGGLSVSAAGGWLMGVGLSALCRSYGTGIDNVIDFDIVLPNGEEKHVDACENPDLFWALRGGGGGTFGVVTAVHYRLWPKQSVVSSIMSITYDNTTDVFFSWIDKWVDLSVKLDKRWGGYWTLNSYILYFLGDMSDANTTFLNDIHEWKMSLPENKRKLVNINTKISDSYYDSRGGPETPYDPTGKKVFNIASRLIPKDWVEKNPKKAKDLLKHLVVIGFYTFNYVLGGEMHNIPSNETAVHPAMRKAIWQIETFNNAMISVLRTVPNSAPGYNHASKKEPNWEEAFWGEHLPQLQSLKTKYDPNNRLNCWHCVGYIEQKLIKPPPVPRNFYCMPWNATCWPDDHYWKDLEEQTDGKLHSLKSSMYEECVEQGSSAYNISKTGHGICMQYHDCSKRFCNGSREWNLPVKSVEVTSVKDIQTTLAFANRHNIAITIKTSGHSYSGSSTGAGTLMIWMRNFTKFTTDGIKRNYTDTCGKKYDKVLKVGGGETWKDAYSAVGSQYNMVGGGGLSVSAAGGWLMGVGLSALCRSYGTGIDNVIDFDIVLPNGEEKHVDACENPDLFWALRGGGGGTFGVVTAVHYRLWPKQSVVSSIMSITYDNTTDVFFSWIDKWVDLSVKLDKRWGGYWTLNSYILYFLGDMSDANTTFLNDIHEWKMSLPENKRKLVNINTKISDSYYDSRGGPETPYDPTGEKVFNIASRLIPKDWVEENPKKAKDLLKHLVVIGFYTFNYVLGGEMHNIPSNETAVHPAMRKAIWQIETFNDAMISVLRTVPNSAPGYNHASKKEPNWEEAFWGEHLPRLQSLKTKYDPNNRLNCWHCVGYIEQILDNNSPTKPPSTTVGFGTMLKASAAILMLSMCLFALMEV